MQGMKSPKAKYSRSHILLVLILLLLSIASTGTVLAAEIKSHFDRFIPYRGNYIARGWVCALNDPKSLDIRIYIGGSATNGGTLAATGKADDGNEAAVDDRCGNVGGNHRFNVIVSASRAKVGQGVYVHAIYDGKNPTIHRGNGELKVPVIPPYTIKGYVESIKAHQGNYYQANGWVCVHGDSSSLDVHIYMGGKAGIGKFAGAGKANIPNNAGIDRECGNTGGKHRFQVKLDPSRVKVGEGMYVHVIYGNNPTIHRGNGELKAPAPPTDVVKGVLDSFRAKGSNYLASGWVCAYGVSRSLDVHIYVGGVAGVGTFAGAGKANNSNEAAVDRECGNTGGKHRFRVEIAASRVKVGQGVYVHAIYGTNPTIHRGKGELKVPLPFGSIVVGAGESHTLPQGQSDAPEVHVHGVLRCPLSTTVTLKTRRFVVHSGGRFECGTAQQPVRGLVHIVLTGSDADENSRTFLVKAGGRLDINGEIHKSTRSRLREEARKGSTMLRLRDSVAGKWQVGDEIVLATTEFNRQPDMGQNERLVVSAISADGFDVSVQRPLRYTHYGGKPARYANDQFFLDESAHVFNLKRNVRISSDNSAGPIGGHVLLLRGSVVKVVGLELFHMGQAGRMGRYPFHWHRAGDVLGQFLKGSSIHDSFQRCIVIHGTNKVLVQDNTCFDFHGHGIFLEDGDEVQNNIKQNLVVLAKKAIPGRELLQSEHHDADIDRFPSPGGLWISNPNNYVVGNVAIASEGTGIWMSFVRNLCCKPQDGCTQRIGNAQQCKKEFGSSATFMNVSRMPTGKFDFNVGASSVVGMNWDGAALGELVDNPNNNNVGSLGLGDRKIVIVHYAPPTVPVFVGNVMYKNSRRALYFRGEQAIFDRCLFADNGGAPLFAYNQVLRNSLVVGWSANAELEYFHDRLPSERLAIKARKLAYGLNLYDGPLVLDNLYAAGFPSVSVVRNGVSNSQDYAPRLIRTVGAAERFVNLAKRVFFHDDEKPKNLYTFSVRGQAAALYDKYGIISGVAGSTITGDEPVNDDANCNPGTPGSMALVCTNYKVGTITFRRSGSSGLNFEIVRRGPSGGALTPTDPRFMGTLRHYQVITSRGASDYRYHMTKIGAKSPDQMSYIFRHDTRGGLSPPLILHYANQCKGTARWSIPESIRTYSTEQALASHTSTGRSAVFYDDAKKIAGIRVAANKDRTILGLYPGAGARAESHVFSLKCTGNQFTADDDVNGIRGHVDSVRVESDGKITVHGWACLIGVDVAVKMKVTSSDGTVLLTPTVTNRSSEQGVHNACQTSFQLGTKHRFVFPLTQQPESLLVFSLYDPSLGRYREFSRKSFATQLPNPIAFTEYRKSLRDNDKYGYVAPTR